MSSDAKGIERWVRHISNAALWLGAASLLLLAGVIVFAALARLFGTALVGSSEIVDVAIIVVASMALVAGTAANTHPSVHILTSRLSDRRQRALKILASLLACAFFGLLCYESTRVLIDYARLGEHTQLLRINITPFRALWVLSLAVICVLLLLRVSLIRRGADNES
jgi:TRAP-type C4-dicarboxylate transport system permease small subunit